MRAKGGQYDGVKSKIRGVALLLMSVMVLGTTGAESAMASSKEFQWNDRPMGTELEVLSDIPSSDYMIQAGLSGSKEWENFSKKSLEPEQIQDIADINYGVSLIGVSGLAYPINGVCDGIWASWNTGTDKKVSKAKNSYGGVLTWYPEFSEDGNVVKYDVNGGTGEEEDNRYISLLTYHFERETDFSAFAFFAQDQQKFPQAGDVYVSDDGTDWILVGSWDRNARREAGKDYDFQKAYMDWACRTGSCVTCGFSLDRAKGKYLRFAFTAAEGRDVNEGEYSDFSVAPGNAMSIAELAVYGTEEKVWGEEEILYNGIVLQEGWMETGPDNMSVITDPEEIPYLISIEEGGTRPDVIDVTVGRQLFVDNFLIEETDLTLNYHSASKYEDNPIVIPKTTGEIQGNASAVMTGGGVWYDMEEKLFKMWYSAGFVRRLAYAVSSDGIHWERPELNEDGSNLILPEEPNVDGSAVWIDYDAPSSERYKMMIRLTGLEYPAYLYTSADGIQWDRLEADTLPNDDRTSFFYNPFREKWVLSVKLLSYRTPIGRCRIYAETDDFSDAWRNTKQFYWMKTDNLDQAEEPWNVQPQIYHFDAVAYESIMLGKYQIWLGPENNICSEGKFPKITELDIAYSRDGFHFDRPDRTPFIAATRKEGDWDRGYLHSPLGGVIVFDDEIWFYYSGFSGSYTAENGKVIEDMYYGGSIGLAKLRRDGFASLDGTGTILTRPITVSGDRKYLFVNLNSSTGSLKAEILDADGNPIQDYTMEDCLGVSGDTTKSKVEWKNGSDLSFLNDQVFQIRFQIEDGEFYSFWLSTNEQGDSDGMTAAGLVDSADLTAADDRKPTEEGDSETAEVSGAVKDTDTEESPAADAEEGKTAEEESVHKTGIQAKTFGVILSAAAIAAGGIFLGVRKKRKK